MHKCLSSIRVRLFGLSTLKKINRTPRKLRLDLLPGGAKYFLNPQLRLESECNNSRRIKWSGGSIIKHRLWIRNLVEIGVTHTNHSTSTLVIVWSFFYDHQPILNTFRFSIDKSPPGRVQLALSTGKQGEEGNRHGSGLPPPIVGVRALVESQN